MSYRIDAGLPLTAEVQRIAAEEIDGALRHLATVHVDPDKALHGCRKRLKSLRALLRLVRSGDKALVRRENARYRDVSASLAGLREAAALIETVDRLAAAYPDRTAGGALAPVREKLVLHRNTLLEGGMDLAAAVDAATKACKAGMRRLGKLTLPDQPESAADVLADGARKTLRRARKALQRIDKDGDATDFHDLRKAVKAHTMHLSLLKTLWPPPVRAQRKAFDALGEKLGELHDIFVLRALLEDESRPLGNRAETRLLSRLVGRSERTLKKTCLAEATRLLGDGPRRSVKKLARKARSDLAKGSRRKAGDDAGHEAAT
jgi:CHAD domain-containing protein